MRITICESQPRLVSIPYKISIWRESRTSSIGDASGLEVTVNQMSTQLRGEFEDVTRAVQQALASSFQIGGPQVLVAKFLNADLPILEAPDLDAPG